MRIVDISCRLDITLDPLPDLSTVEQLLADAEHDCFVGASLKAQTVYQWWVNGELQQPGGVPTGMRVPRSALEEVARASTPPDTTAIVCSSCGRTTPPGESAAWNEWNPAGLELAELADATAAVGIIYPACRAEEHSVEELGGG